jgi:hypothetical protein
MEVGGWRRGDELRICYTLRIYYTIFWYLDDGDEIDTSIYIISLFRDINSSFNKLLNRFTT